MHDALFAHPNALGRADLERHAAALGLDLHAFRAALDRGTFRAAVETDQALAARVGAGGTPSFFVNGRYMSGAWPEATFRSMIDAALARARDLMRERGLARGQVYAEVQRDALDKAEGTPLAPPAYRREPDLSATYQIPVGSSPVRGAATALITIVAFMDYQCPYCGRAEATLADLRTRFGKDLRIVCKHNPLAFHSHAALAAEAALAARAQGRFWQMHDKLFANQAALERADLERYATEIGLDLRRFRAALDARTYKAAVEADQQLAQRFGARGTPTFYVNGRVLLGAQPLDAFVQSCEDARARARALAAKRRIRPERLYEELTRDGLMRLAPPGSGEDARVPVPVSGRRRLPQRRGAFGAGRSRSRSNARRRRRASAPP